MFFFVLGVFCGTMGFGGELWLNGFWVRGRPVDGIIFGALECVIQHKPP